MAVTQQNGKENMSVLWEKNQEKNKSNVLLARLSWRLKGELIISIA